MIAAPQCGETVRDEHTPDGLSATQEGQRTRASKLNREGAKDAKEGLGNVVPNGILVRIAGGGSVS